MIIEVTVKPNSRESLLEQTPAGAWQARLKSPPVDGKANAELMGLVARHFGCSKSQVTIKTGGRGRKKLVEIAE
ncbi:MAG: hypothetical protein C0478_11205 [Planctomyces sp.]|jgi:hypothetical protein|nr:hypothetical protein [Planctomyces sp.]